ncbi:MAG TPA: HAMP domain-containing sensor histidine kinase, partial [Bacteroidia bacterium]
MKLTTKTILYYLLVSLPLLAISMVAGYYLVGYELHDATDEALEKDMLRAEKIIETQHPKSTFYLSADSLSNITIGGAFSEGDEITDSVIYDHYEEEYLPYRILRNHVSEEGSNYTITIAKPTLEHDDLMEGLLMAFSLLVGFLLVAFFILNWMLSRTLWKPFYQTLEKLHTYDLKKDSGISFNKTSTKEFNNLNQSLQEMIHKIETDFIQQKEFTENASHEMQTPLAVIKANVSLLMQSGNMKAEEMEQLQAIDNTTKKLASLNKSLILLTKIENNQFRDRIRIDLSVVLNKVIANYEEVIEAKNIRLKTQLAHSISTLMDPILADILLSNLLQNAIRHNSHSGSITIASENNSLIISNTGEPLKVNPADLFVR